MRAVAQNAPPLFFVMKNLASSSLCLLLYFVSLSAEPDVLHLGPYGGDVRTLAVHPSRPNKIFLGTADGQIFISENSGETWGKVTPGLRRRELVVDSIVFHPTMPDTVYAAGWELKSDRGALFRSNDGGSSWERIDLGRFESSIRAVAIAAVDPELIAVGINEGVLVSKDSGANWERISRGYRSLYNVHSLRFAPDSETLYVGTFRLAWKTDDLGKSWTAIHNGMFWDSDLFSIQIDPFDPDTVFAGACSGIYRSYDRGEKWTRLRNGLPPEAKRTRVLRFDPKNRNRIYAGTTEGLYRSTNGGDSWQLLLPDVVLNAVLINPEDSNVIILGTDDAGVLKSTDGGRTFSESNVGFSQRQVSSIAVASRQAERLFAAVALDSHHGGFFESQDGGSSWQAINEGLPSEVIPTIRIILPSRVSEKVYLATPTGLFHGVPNRIPWEPIKSTSGLVVNDIAFGDGSEKELYIASRKGLYRLRLESGGLDRLEVRVYDREFFAITSDPEQGFLFAGTDMGIFRSDDGGDSWSAKLKGLPFAPVNTVRKVGDRLFCGTKNGLFFSDDLGTEWSPAEGVFPIEIVTIESDIADDKTVYAADLLVGYFFLSRDGGDSWKAYELGQILSRISSLSVAPSGALLAGTVAEGVVRIVPPTQAANQRVEVVVDAERR